MQFNKLAKFWQIFESLKPNNISKFPLVAQDCQKSLEQTNDEIRMYKSHAEKLNEILSAKNLEIAKLSGDNEKLSGLKF